MDKTNRIIISTQYVNNENVVLLKVMDEGVGISEEDLPLLTEPFFTTKREKGGTGLGLSISSSIVNEHGGIMHFDSKPGLGMTVTVKFPVNGFIEKRKNKNAQQQT